MQLGKLIFLFLCIGFSAFADSVNNEWYQGARPLGMGDVGVASADDPMTAMFYNPAALAKVRRSGFEFINPQLTVGDGNFALAPSILDISKQTSLPKVQPLLGQHPNTPVYWAASMYPNFYAQNFAFGMLAQGEMGAHMDQYGNLYYRAKYVLMPTAAMSLALLNGKLKLGAAARAIQLTESDVSTSTLTNLNYLNNAQEGFGIGFDGGAQIVLPFATTPTFGVMAHNIGGTKFSRPAIYSLAKGTPVPHPTIAASYDGGFSISPKFNRQNMSVFEVDYKDILNSTNTVLWRKLNFGMEFGLNRFLYLRGGVRSGYYTAGIGVMGKNASLEFATYADELDSRGFRVLADRRYLMRFGSHF